jgi:hypothetical protein
MATAVVGYLAKDSINKGKEMASADLDKVKGDTINALKQLQSSIIYSLTDTETYALGQCLKQCQTKAKAMLAAYNASLQSNDSISDAAPSADAVMGGNKKKRKSRNTYRKGNKKYSKTKKYRR